MIIDRVEQGMSVLAAPFRPLLRGGTYRSLLFLTASLPVGAAALALLIAGWVAGAVLLVTPLVVAVLIGFRGAIGLLATADAAAARALLGVETHPRISSGGRGYWRRGLAVVADRAFWKQQAYLALRLTFGFGLAVTEVSLVAASLQAIVYPITYRWSDLHFWSWHVDTAQRALVLVPAGVLGLIVAGWSALALGKLAALTVRAFLDDGAAAGRVSRRARGWALRFHAAASAGIAVLLLLIWALTGHGYVWPEWAILPLGLLLACHAWLELVDRRPRARLGRSRALAAQLGISVALLLFFVLVWAFTTRGSFWPEWPALGLAIALAAHAAIDRGMRDDRVARRVGVLESTRTGAVNAQAAELRRIERDLHDGAQARLVALGMSLGLAEQRFASDPEGARQLVSEARHGVGEALRELRDFARGIHPPVLSDRGLGAALETLVDQTQLPVSVSVALDERLPPNLETTAYFVVAEALANAAKHSGATSIAVRVRRENGSLGVDVEDDGRGGADPSGSGLTGLRLRVEALDGTLAVSSPPGGPTLVHVELPCGS
jgi:signal transduction histidine kinase